MRSAGAIYDYCPENDAKVDGGRIVGGVEWLSAVVFLRCFLRSLIRKLGGDDLLCAPTVRIFGNRTRYKAGKRALRFQFAGERC